MPLERLKPSFTFDKELIKQLEQLVPECFEDGKINWELLKESLGEFLEDESPDAEHFGLNWPGKKEARKMAFTPSRGNLVPLPGEGIDEEKTGNIFIEGENLEVLKLLQKSYAGRIKMIYIDPPYNTGNDFVYEDDFSEPLEEYLRRTGQLDEQGKPLTTNTKADGRFHSKWLSMMYPRLRLARNLLRDDGVIFISIDDNEVSNLRKICDELFGEENFVSFFVWQSKKGGGNDANTVVVDHEYILCYARQLNNTSLSRIIIEPEKLDKIDEKGPYRRGRELNKWGSNSRREDRPTMFFPIPGPNGEEVYPIRNDGKEGCWRWGKKKMAEIVEKSDVEFVKRIDGTYIVYEKIRTSDPRNKPFRTWLTDIGITADGSKVVKELFDNLKIFDFPKPIDLIKYIISMGYNEEEGIILDFFAGAATTAHTIFNLNKEDNGKRKFIMVQLPEPCNITSEAFKAGYKTIAEIGKERIRRVIKKLNEEQEGKLDLDDDNAQDRGFKVFKLEKSNYKSWNNYEGTDIKKLELQYDMFESPLVDDWNEESLLTEILLCEGFPLDSKIEKLDNKENKLIRVSSDFCEHKLLICLDKKVEAVTVENLELQYDEIFICLDNAINDIQKLILTDKGVIKTI